jgi:hypothetical protein
MKSKCIEITGNAGFLAEALLLNKILSLAAAMFRDKNYNLTLMVLK